MMYRTISAALAVTILACGSDGGGSIDGGSVDAGGSGADATHDLADAAASLDGQLDDAAQGDATQVDAAPIADADPNLDAEAPPVGSIVAPPYLMWASPTAVTVMWETASATIGTVDYGPTAALGATISEDSPTTLHELRLTDLAPGAENFYKIWFDGFALPMSSFRTALPADDTSPFTFLVWGDNQNGSDTFATIVEQMVVEEAHFAITVGDLVQDGTRANYRSQLFTPLAPLADHVSFLVAGGNHSRYGDPDLFDEYFAQPGDEHCFGWRWGELFIIFIDSEDDNIIPGSPQGDCITTALSSAAATEATFQAAIFHKPPRIEWWYGGLIAFTDEMEAPWIREALEPLLESYGVDLIFNGHNHLYAHTPETTGGITLVTTGGGGGGLDTSFFMWDVGNWPEIDTTIHEHHFLSVAVTSTEITVTAVDIDGVAMHQFTVLP